MFEDAINDRPISGRQKVMFSLCLLVLIIDGLDAALLAFASPVLLAEWHVTKAQLAPALAMSLVGMAIGAPLGGLAGDRFGCRRALITVVALFGLTTLACASVNGVSQLIVFRFLSGIGFGIAVPTAMALASEWSPRKLRGQMIVLMSVGPMVGGTLGALLAAKLIPAFGWRSVFVVSGSITLVSAVLSVIYLPESLVFLIRKGRQTEALDWVSRMVRGSATAVPVSAERRSLDVPTTAAGTRLFSLQNLRLNGGLWIAFFTLSYAAFAYICWTPTFLVADGFNLENAIRYTSIYTFSAVISVPVCAVLLPRTGSRALLLLSIAATAAATIAFPSLLTTGVTHAAAVKIAMLLAGFGGGMSQSTIYAIAGTAYPATYRATALGVCVGVSRAGGILGALGGGVLLEAGGTTEVLFFGVIACMLIAGLIALAAMNRHIAAASSIPRRVTI
ncbi:MFS transporter [Burkholderia sp. S171]|uniref:MFS transporter n=1 Tax=Burkholderia sp. S171 TaxID=1641860 RepID=UPI00131B8717|nr:MFS transporter [Burkholderia sp. S171]